MRHSICCIAVLTTLLVWEADLAAQEVRSANEVASALRMNARGSIRDAREVLQQVHAKYTAAELDAVADVLTEVVISNDLRAGDVRSEADVRTRRHTSGEALAVLRSAATGNDGVRYAGAAVKLLEIAKADVYYSPGAALSLADLPDREEALEYLRQVVVADTRASADAVRALKSEEIAPDGLEVLREVYEHDLDSVTNVLGRDVIEAVAYHEGWK